MTQHSDKTIIRATDHDLLTHLDGDESSVSNEDLYNDPTAQQWLQKLVGVGKGDFPGLQWQRIRGVPINIPSVCR